MSTRNVLQITCAHHPIHIIQDVPAKVALLRFGICFKRVDCGPNNFEKAYLNLKKMYMHL